MNPIVIIPARLGSTRLSNKPLAEIGGVPMIVRVWREAVRADIGPVYVAAAEEKIANVVSEAGGKAVLTDPALPSGTDRVHEALRQLDRKETYDAVINMQGDIPAFEPVILRKAMQALSVTGNDIATLAHLIGEDEVENPNLVKVVVAWHNGESHGRALYFSRARLPYGEGPYFGHIGIYAYTRAALSHFVAFPPSELEKREKLEQLRALEAGMTIAVARVEAPPLSVDTPEDLQKARALLR
ncbi:MAG: 3-deoxy-manno-octulosonate cytidylyltransferase [Alphaproteobacteria bacterium]